MTDEILDAREKTHGYYPVQSAAAQGMKDIIRAMPNYHRMPPFMRESLDMIVTKIARMGHGNAFEPDHVDDIIGYAELIAKEIKK